MPRQFAPPLGTDRCFQCKQIRRAEQFLVSPVSPVTPARTASDELGIALSIRVSRRWPLPGERSVRGRQDFATQDAAEPSLQVVLINGTHARPSVDTDGVRLSSAPPPGPRAPAPGTLNLGKIESCGTRICQEAIDGR